MPRTHTPPPKYIEVFLFKKDYFPGHVAIWDGLYYYSYGGPTYAPAEWIKKEIQREDISRAIKDDINCYGDCSRIILPVNSHLKSEYEKIRRTITKEWVYEEYDIIFSNCVDMVLAYLKAAKYPTSSGLSKSFIPKSAANEAKQIGKIYAEKLVHQGKLEAMNTFPKMDLIKMDNFIKDAETFLNSSLLSTNRDELKHIIRLHDLLKEYQNAKDKCLKFYKIRLFFQDLPEKDKPKGSTMDILDRNAQLALDCNAENWGSIFRFLENFNTKLQQKLTNPEIKFKDPLAEFITNEIGPFYYYDLLAFLARKHYEDCEDKEHRDFYAEWYSSALTVCPTTIGAVKNKIKQKNTQESKEYKEVKSSELSSSSIDSSLETKMDVNSDEPHSIVQFINKQNWKKVLMVTLIGAGIGIGSVFTFGTLGLVVGAVALVCGAGCGAGVGFLSVVSGFYHKYKTEIFIGLLLTAAALLTITTMGAGGIVFGAIGGWFLAGSSLTPKLIGAACFISTTLFLPTIRRVIKESYKWLKRKCSSLNNTILDYQAALNQPQYFNSPACVCSQKEDIDSTPRPRAISHTQAEPQSKISRAHSYSAIPQTEEPQSKLSRARSYSAIPQTDPQSKLSRAHSYSAIPQDPLSPEPSSTRFLSPPSAPQMNTRRLPPPGCKNPVDSTIGKADPNPSTEEQNKFLI